MSADLERDMERVQRGLVSLAGRVEEQVLASVRAAETRDLIIADRVQCEESTIDRLEVEIEEECLRMLEEHRPTGHRLRLLVSLLKINHDLEDVADLAAAIAERAQYLAEHDPIAPPFPLMNMARIASQMLRASLDSLVARDAEQAREVCSRDDEIDIIHRASYIQVEEKLRRNSDHVERLIQWLSVSRNLERIADLASNIARDVVYIVEGKIVRHRPLLTAVAKRA